MSLEGMLPEDLADMVRELTGELENARCRIAEATADKDAAYTERNRVVALLARIYPSGIRKTEIDGWDPEWNGCVFIDSPVGQLSWHYHDREANRFEGLPPYEKPWDGHTTPEKYARIDRLMTVLMLSRSPAHPTEPVTEATIRAALERGARDARIVAGDPVMPPEPTLLERIEELECEFINSGQSGARSLDPWCRTHERSAICCLRSARGAG